MKQEATVRWTGRMTFVGKAGTNHLIPMDTTPEFDGDDSATKPLELLLIALGGCTGMDVVPLLKPYAVDHTAACHYGSHAEGVAVGQAQFVSRS